jgi:hypothetical protein
MSKFDQIISEFSNGNSIIPQTNEGDLTQKLSGPLKSLPKNVSDVLRGVGDALSNASEKSPLDAELIDRLKDPNAQYKPEEVASLQKILLSRGISFNQEKENTVDTQKEPTQTSKSSTTYGGNLQGV